VRLGPLGCCTKLGAKRAELVQKFVPRSRVGIFRTESTRSTPLDPELTFWCVSYYLSAFGIIWLPYKTLRKTGGSFLHKFVPRSRVGIFRKERTRSTPLDPKLMFWCISYHFGAFGAFWFPYETRCKTGRTSAKVRAMKSLRNFLQRTHVTHQWDIKLMFWCISYFLGAFETVWLPYETRCKTSRTSAKLRATKSRWNFSQQAHPIHPIGP